MVILHLTDWTVLFVGEISALRRNLDGFLTSSRSPILPMNMALFIIGLPWLSLLFIIVHHYILGNQQFYHILGCLDLVFDLLFTKFAWSQQYRMNKLSISFVLGGIPRNSIVTLVQSQLFWLKSMVKSPFFSLFKHVKSISQISWSLGDTSALASNSRVTNGCDELLESAMSASSSGVAPARCDAMLGEAFGDGMQKWME